MAWEGCYRAVHYYELWKRFKKKKGSGYMWGKNLIQSWPKQLYCVLLLSDSEGGDASVPAVVPDSDGQCDGGVSSHLC